MFVAHTEHLLKKLNKINKYVFEKYQSEKTALLFFTLKILKFPNPEFLKHFSVYLKYYHFVHTFCGNYIEKKLLKYHKKNMFT